MYWKELCFIVLIHITLAYSTFVDPMKHEITSVTSKNFDSALNRQRGSLLVTLLLHYTETDQNQKKFINDVYNEAAKETKGMLKFFAINCAKSTEFCEKEQKTSDLKFPTIFIYSPNPIVPFEKLNPVPTKDEIVKAALKYIPGNNVTPLNKDIVSNFLSDNPALPKLILFSTKSHVPTMYKALSNSFKDRVNFGIVPPSEINLEKEYKIKNRPTLLRFNNQKKTPDVYSGAFNFTQIYSWINVNAETFVKGGGFVENTNEPQIKRKTWLSEKVAEITGESFKDLCFKHNTLSVIYLTAKNITSQEIEQLHKLADKYTSVSQSGARFRWSWLNLGIEKDFAKVFDKELDDLPSCIILNTNRRIRFESLPKDQKATVKNIEALLEKILSGSGRFTPLTGNKFPNFASRNTETNENRSKSNEEL